MGVRSRFLRNLISLFFCTTFYEDDPGAAGGGGGGGDNKGDFKFSGEFVEIKDPKTGNKIKVPKELKMDEIIGHTISTTRDTVEEKYKNLMTEIENLKSENKDLSRVQEEYQRLRESQMSEKEKIESNAAKVIKDHERAAKEATETAAKWKALFEKSTIRNDILSSFGDVKLFNPGQVALLFENEGNARISEKIGNDGKPTGKFETMLTLTLEDKDGKPETIEGTPSELFQKWIDLERNFHHRQNELPPGGGTPPSAKGKGAGIDWGSMKATDKLNKARELGLTGSK